MKIFNLLHINFNYRINFRRETISLKYSIKLLILYIQLILNLNIFFKFDVYYNLYFINNYNI